MPQGRGNGRNGQRHNGRQKNHRLAGLPADLGAGDNAPDPVSLRMPADTVVDVMAMVHELAPNAPLPVVPDVEGPAEPQSVTEPQAAEPIPAAPVTEQPEVKPAEPEPAPAPKRRGRKPKAKSVPVEEAKPDGANPTPPSAPVPDENQPAGTLPADGVQSADTPADVTKPAVSKTSGASQTTTAKSAKPAGAPHADGTRTAAPQPAGAPLAGVPGKKVPMGGVPASAAPNQPRQWARGPQGNPIVDIYRPPVPPSLPEIHLKDLQSKSVVELLAYLPNLTVEEASNIQKHQIIFEIIRNYLRKGGTVVTSGVLETISDGYGFLRSPKSNYLQCPEDVFVAPSQIRRFALRTGDQIQGTVREPREKERFFAMARVDLVNGKPAAEARRTTHFEDLTPLFPDRRIRLETKPEELSMRIMDIFTPIGFGQRGLIVAPPRTGKTVLMQKLANAISENHPDVSLMILLIDERPEEVTDMQRNTKAQVISSTFDEAPERHIQVAEMVIEVAKRQVENGKDVVILLDSITRLARAYNTVQPHSGRVLTGGVDANALHKPKRFFGAARNIEKGGSLTIISTALIDTGSRMDEVIFEEFKGTGNMELNLDRELSDKRVYPAINIEKSGTRKEELLLYPEELNRTWILRRALTGVPTVEAMEMVIKRIKATKSNAEFLVGIKE